MDVELTDTAWVVHIPTAPNYTAAQASHILGSGVSFIAASETLQGPASTDARPVDHDALVQYVLAREKRHQRLRARRQLKWILEEHLGRL